MNHADWSYKGYVASIGYDFSSTCLITITNHTHTKQENMSNNVTSSSLTVITAGISMTATTATQLASSVTVESIVRELWVN